MDIIVIYTGKRAECYKVKALTETETEEKLVAHKETFLKYYLSDNMVVFVVE